MARYEFGRDLPVWLRQPANPYDDPPDIVDMTRLLTGIGVASEPLARDLATRIVHALDGRLLPPLVAKVPRWRAVTPVGTVKGIEEDSARALVRRYGGRVEHSYVAVHQGGYELLHPWTTHLGGEIDRSPVTVDPEQQKP